MQTKPQDEELPAYQMIPKGMWHMIGAIVCMAPALGLLLAVMALVGSQWLSSGAVLVIGLVAFSLSVLILVTPTFLLSRGRAQWHGFLLRLNLSVIGALVVASAVSLLLEEVSLFLTAAIGIGLAVLARCFYKAKSFVACVEYYRIIWDHHRSAHQ